MSCEKTDDKEMDFESDFEMETEENGQNVLAGSDELNVEKLLGRKYVKDSDGNVDELYFIKWKKMSYLHASWERREDIERVDSHGKQKIKRFLLSHQPHGVVEYLPNDNVITSESLIELNDLDDDEEIDYFNPDLVDIQRIIACDTPLVSHSTAKSAACLIKVKSKKRKTSSSSLSTEDGSDPDGAVKYLVKWRGQSYDECTWERWDEIKEFGYEEVWTFWQTQRAPKFPLSTPAFPTLQDYHKLHESPCFGLSVVAKSTESDEDRNAVDGSEFTKNDAGLRLRDYQLEGVNWLLWNWWHKRSCILADEMGLGKTIQTIGFLHQLRFMQTTNLAGPFLIIAPLSLVDQWQSEVGVWSPDMNCVLLHGNNAARELIVEHEFFFKEPSVSKTEAAALKKAGVCKFHILLTTFEVAVKEVRLLSKIKWQVMVVDEAHKLKNQTSRLFTNLVSIPHQHCLLLTGTPLQNKTEELWALLNFADSKRFADLGDFITKFGDLKVASQVAKLHDVLKPYLLRRIKEDVEKSLPPKEETIVEVALTAVQKRFYKAIYEKNTQYLFKGLRPSNQPSLMNVMMELRKCCNHPYLVKGVEERVVAEIPPEMLPLTDDLLHQKLVESSGKLVLLDKLLPRLFSEGHKVLIFSQMVRVLNLLEDFLRHKKYSFERLDGSTKSSDRKEAVERFCKPSANKFIMLLSTKAGGLGLNLTAADTVVIFDSDWNPQNDLQAQARAHRIGQTNPVMVYRLLTRKTYEMEMFHHASMKLGLDRAVLAHSRIEQEAENSKALRAGKMEDVDGSKPNFSTKEIDELLKRGAYDVFRDDDSEQKEFVEADIDSILQRRAHKVTYDSSNGGVSNSLGSFSKASFVSADDKEAVDINDPDFWRKAVGLKEEVVELGEDDLVPQQRVRKQTQLYSDESKVGESELKEMLRPIKSDKPTKTAVNKELALKEKQEREDAKQQKIAAENLAKNDPKTWGSHARDRVLRALNMYGFGRWERIKNESGNAGRDPRCVESFSRAYILQCGLCASEQDLAKNDSDFVRDAISAAKTVDALVRSGQRVLEVPPSLLEDKFLGKLKSGLAKKSLNKLDVLTKLVNMMQKVVEDAYRAKGLPVSCSADLDELFAELTLEEVMKVMPLGDVRPSWTRIRPWWDLECDLHLLIGVYKHGYGRYDLLKDDLSLVFNQKLALEFQQQQQSAKNNEAKNEVSAEGMDDSLLLNGASALTQNSEVLFHTEGEKSGDEDKNMHSSPPTTLVHDPATSAMEVVENKEEVKVVDAEEDALDQDMLDTMDESGGGDGRNDANDEMGEDGQVLFTNSSTSSSGPVMPDARSVNRLFGWLVSSDAARMSKDQLIEKQKLIRKTKTAEDKKESARAAKAAAAAEQQMHAEENGDRKVPESSEELELMSHLHEWVDVEAIAIAFKAQIQGMKKCEAMFALPVYASKDTIAAVGEEAGSGEMVAEDSEVTIVEAGDVMMNVEAEFTADNITEAADGGDVQKTGGVTSLSEVEAVRLCCALILFGAPPISVGADAAVPSDVLHLMGIQSAQRKVATGSGLVQMYDWTALRSRCQLRLSEEQLEEFHRAVWLPFCQAITLQRQLSFSQKKCVVPNPLLSPHNHHYAARGLCHVFLVRQQLLHASRHVLQHDLAGLMEYLRGAQGRNVDNMPMWWCPWIHDLGIIVGLAKHGFLALRELKSDPELPFTPEYLDLHVRQVFVLGSSSVLPAGLDDIKSVSAVETFVQASILQFPEFRDLEFRVMRILENVTRSLPVDHPCRVRSFQALKHISAVGVVAATVSPAADEADQAGETTTVAPEEQGVDPEAAAPSVATGKHKKETAGLPLSRARRAVVKYPAMPLKRFQRETAKRRRISVSASHPECFPQTTSVLPTSLSTATLGDATVDN